jgi:putative membrane protein
MLVWKIGFMRFLLHWINNSISVFVASYLVSGITYKQPVDLFIAALVLGILNTFVRPVIKFFSWPLLLVTFGIFWFVINAFLLYAVGWVMQPAFIVASFKAAFLGALVITIVSFFLNFITGANRARAKVQRNPPPPNRHDGGGPVIDV